MPTILFLGVYDPESARTWTLRKTFKKQGYEIKECRIEGKGKFEKLNELIKQYRKVYKELDEVLVLFPGLHVTPITWVLTRFPRKKLQLDQFISLFDTLVVDRKKAEKWSWKALYCWIMDFFSCHLADEVLTDTKTQREYFINLFKIHPNKIRAIYLEARTDLFFPKTLRSTFDAQHPSFNVFFYGTFIPLQGVDVIVRAAKILENESDIHFTILGRGQTKPAVKNLIEKLNLSNVTLKRFVPMTDLPNQILSSDLCLGIFGNSEKTQRVIPHKVLDYLACGKRVVTSRTPAILEKYENDPRVVMCEAGDEESLAQTILQEFKNVPRQRQLESLR